MRFCLTLSIVIISLHLLKGQAFTRQDINFNINGSFGQGAFLSGGGLSVSDFNDDGLDDLTFATFAGKKIEFYENTGDGFNKIIPSYIDNILEQRQVVWVDFDNDGDKDIFVVALDGPNLLYENDGSMNFTDVTVAKGLSTQVVLSQGANFSDINKDGFLDLYVCNYDEEGITINGFENEMYRWNPQLNLYEDITITSGTGNGLRTSFASAFFDFDLDNDLDLYVVNDFLEHENSLYMNIGNSQFIDVSVPSLSNIAIFSMNAGISDYDKDGDFDIFITDIYQAALLQNNGDNTFSEVAVAAGVAADEWSWTGNFFDYDNDQDDDLYINSQIDTIPNFFYTNNNNGTFSEPLSTSGGITGNDSLESISNAIGDFNNDGKLDIAVNSRGNNNFRIYINNEENNNNFIKLDLKGVDSNKDGIGAYLELWINGSKSILHKYNTISYHCQNSDYLHIGIGQNTSVDSLKIRWPFANNEDLILGANILVNGMNVIEEGMGLIDSYSLEICLITQNIVIDPVPSQIYGAELNIDCATLVTDGSNVLFQSEVGIISLENGFEIELGAEFEAEIEVCGN